MDNFQCSRRMRAKKTNQKKNSSPEHFLGFFSGPGRVDAWPRARARAPDPRLRAPGCLIELDPLINLRGRGCGAGAGPGARSRRRGPRPRARGRGAGPVDRGQFFGPGSPTTRVPRLRFRAPVPRDRSPGPQALCPGPGRGPGLTRAGAWGGARTPVPGGRRVRDPSVLRKLRGCLGVVEGSGGPGPGPGPPAGARGPRGPGPGPSGVPGAPGSGPLKPSQAKIQNLSPQLVFPSFFNKFRSPKGVGKIAARSGNGGK